MSSNIQSLKGEAKRLASHLQEKHNFALSHSHSLHAIAVVHGHANWNTLLGLAESGKQPHEEHEPAMTAEAAKDYLADARGDVDLVAWEESDSAVYLAYKEKGSERVKCCIVTSTGKDYSPEAGCYTADCGREFLSHLTRDPKNKEAEKWFKWVEASEDYMALLQGLVSSYPVGYRIKIESAQSRKDQEMWGRTKVLYMEICEQDGVRFLQGRMNTPAYCQICAEIARGAKVAVYAPKQKMAAFEASFRPQPYMKGAESDPSLTHRILDYPLDEPGESDWGANPKQ